MRWDVLQLIVWQSRRSTNGFGASWKPRWRRASRKGYCVPTRGKLQGYDVPEYQDRLAEIVQMLSGVRETDAAQKGAVISTNPYHAATQRTFRQAIVHLEAALVSPGHIVWRGTLDEGRKPPAGRRAEDEPTVTGVLPLISDADIADLTEGCPTDQRAGTWMHRRDIRRVVRLVKAGQPRRTAAALPGRHLPAGQPLY